MSQHKPLLGKIGLITGGSSGIGAAAAIKLAQKGLHVLLAARSQEKLNAVAEQIRAAGGEVDIYPTDLTDPEERLRIAENIRQQFTQLDILINNAGFGWYGFFHEMDWQVAQNMFRLNIEALTHLTWLFLPGMLARRKGHIINLSSIAAKLPAQGIQVYGASKAYADTFSLALNRELKRSGVSVSVIRPGPIKTAFFEKIEKTPNGQTIPGQSLSIEAAQVADAIYTLILWPRAGCYVPCWMGSVPMLHTVFSWVFDLAGPILLNQGNHRHKN